MLTLRVTASGFGERTSSVNLAVNVTEHFSLEPLGRAPSWHILARIFQKTDFSYTDRWNVPKRVDGVITDAEASLIESTLRRFVYGDVPALSSGYMSPRLTIRRDGTISEFVPYGQDSWQPSPAAYRDDSFDTTIVVFQTFGGELGGGAPGNGGNLSPAYLGLANVEFRKVPLISGAMRGRAVNEMSRNLWKHEFGHAILIHYSQTGAAPRPSVDNHIGGSRQYVHCGSGMSYSLVDETDSSPIPNSIYNNEEGFTHDYYSGTTATPDQPNRCLGIPAATWATGGPVTK
jgi:hypothetical protein